MQPKMSSNAKDSETKDKALEKNSGWVTSDDIKGVEKKHDQNSEFRPESGSTAKKGLPGLT